MNKILLAIPTYKKECVSDLLFKMHRITDGKRSQVLLGNVDSSAICLTMNAMWIQALEGYEAGTITHFAMLHTDIVPEDFFMDKLMDVMEREGADVVAAVAPIKNNMGFTSTAVEGQMGDCDPYFRVKRYTMHEIMALPKSFTHPGMLLNTGLMLVDMSKPWTRSEDVYFTIEDRIVWYRGRRVPQIWPEDWGFSRRARKAGATKLVATREVMLDHIGHTAHPNYIAWGDMKEDVVVAPPLEFCDAATKAAGVRGYMSWDELAWLAEAAKGKDVLEVGSWLGRSTKAMSATATTVYAVDHWKGTINDLTLEEAKTIDPYAEFCHNLGPEINSRKVIPIARAHEEVNPAMTYYDGLTLDTCPLAPVDMVFIDGDHEYEAVKRDIANAKAMLKTGGLLCGHDYDQANHPGVVQAVKELVPGFSVAPGTTIWHAAVGGC